MVTSHPVNTGNLGVNAKNAKPPETLKVTVNGDVQHVHRSVGFITYDRAVRLSGLKWRRNYGVCVSYADKPGLWWNLERRQSMSIEDDMMIEVYEHKKRWWEFWR